MEPIMVMLYQRYIHLIIFVLKYKNNEMGYMSDTTNWPNEKNNMTYQIYESLFSYSLSLIYEIS